MSPPPGVRVLLCLCDADLTMCCDIRTGTDSQSTRSLDSSPLRRLTTTLHRLQEAQLFPHHLPTTRHPWRLRATKQATKPTRGAWPSRLVTFPRAISAAARRDHHRPRRRSCLLHLHLLRRGKKLEMKRTRGGWPCPSGGKKREKKRTNGGWRFLAAEAAAAVRQRHRPRSLLQATRKLDRYRPSSRHHLRQGSSPLQLGSPHPRSFPPLLPLLLRCLISNRRTAPRHPPPRRRRLLLLPRWVPHRGPKRSMPRKRKRARLQPS